MRLVNRLICKFAGHKRGKCTGETLDALKNVIARTIKCPRCETTWTRKERKVA